MYIILIHGIWVFQPSHLSNLTSRSFTHSFHPRSWIKIEILIDKTDINILLPEVVKREEGLLYSEKMWYHIYVSKSGFKPDTYWILNGDLPTTRYNNFVLIRGLVIPIDMYSLPEKVGCEWILFRIKATLHWSSYQ